MKIALIIENSQAAKSETVHAALTAVAEPLGHEVFHYGMYAAEDKASLTYVMNGLLTGLLINAGAADFVVTGCGTGMGSMLAANAMPGVFCGLIIDPTDAFLFGQINDGNAISMPYAKGFGWAAELNLQDVYRKLFEGERGLGYPKERAEIMAKLWTIRSSSETIRVSKGDKQAIIPGTLANLAEVLSEHLQREFAKIREEEQNILDKLIMLD